MLNQRTGFLGPRTRFLSYLIFFYSALCLLQRAVYVIWIRSSTQSWPEGMIPAFLKGIAFDLATCGFLFLPLALLLGAFPRLGQSSRAARVLVLVLAVLPLLVGLNSIGFEFFFWDEFQARYNFIAVDYLVYTHEVVRNIWESYPVVWFFLGLFTVVSLVGWRLSRSVKRMLRASAGGMERAALILFILGLVALNQSLREDQWLQNDPFWGRELAKNSLYALFSAYNRNSIDYKQFYVSMPSEEARAAARDWLVRDAGPGVAPASGGMGELARDIRSNAPEKRWNVMFVAIESLSARFLGQYGNTQGLTPNLDRFAKEGLWFSKLYATGSRTVRGLEALMLSLPPTPGQSILRRPNSDRLFNLGTLFAERGYVRQFVYGGYAAFDNMGPWFASNGFDVVDRSSFAPGGVTFATAWGACDEDLFAESIRRADEAHQKNQRFFQVMLTTSNHRPYDFPNGRIDIPSHSGRDGAVKYTDYAIGKFVEDAKKHAWFKDTVFVFVADHNASVAGGTDIPIRDYLIPVIVYNPHLVKPQVIETLSSQIDVAPTLAALLGFSYKSWFFGQNLFQARPNRALIGTYQKVALLEPGVLALLEPGRRTEMQTLGELGQVLKTEKFAAGAAIPAMITKTAAIYQSASELFFEGLSKVQERKVP